jgi:hypothetical protein
LRGVEALEAGPHLTVDLRVRRPVFALVERLPHAHDRRHAAGDDRTHLAVDVLVRLAEQLPALGVARDHVGDVELGQHRRADLAGKSAPLLPVAVLGTQRDRDAVALERRLHRADVGERWVHRHVHHVVVALAQEV